MHRFLTPGGFALVNLACVEYVKELPSQTFRVRDDPSGIFGPAVMLHFSNDRLTVNSTLDQIEQLSRSGE